MSLTPSSCLLHLIARVTTSAARLCLLPQDTYLKYPGVFFLTLRRRVVSKLSVVATDNKQRAVVNTQPPYVSAPTAAAGRCLFTLTAPSSPARGLAPVSPPLPSSPAPHQVQLQGRCFRLHSHLIHSTSQEGLPPWALDQAQSRRYSSSTITCRGQLPRGNLSSRRPLQSLNIPTTIFD